MWPRPAGPSREAIPTPKTPPRTGLYKADGSFVRWIEENPLVASHPFHPYIERLRPMEFGTIKAADGQTLHWSMRTPFGFDPKTRYPVIVQVYGGPAGALVERRWETPADQLLTDAGYILFSIDNRGTPNRSVAFKTAIDRRTGGPDVDDQLAGAAFLKSLPYVDGARLGVTGYSGSHLLAQPMPANHSLRLQFQPPALVNQPWCVT